MKLPSVRLPALRLPAVDDVLLLGGALGAGVSVGGLFGALWGVLLVSGLSLAGGVLLGRNSPRGGVG